MTDPRDSSSPAPSGPKHTTIVRSDNPIARMEFVDDDDRWFRFLNQVVDTYMAGLSLSGLKVLLVYARHADHDQVVRVGMKTLRQATGLGRSAIYAGRDSLISLRLLVPIDDEGTYRVFPRRLAGKRKRTTDSDGGSDSGCPPTRTECPRTWTGCPPGRTNRPRTWTPLLGEEERERDDDERRRSVVVEVDEAGQGGGSGRDDPAEMLVRLEGFDPEDARRLVHRTGATADDVMTAHLNAKSVKSFRSSRRGFIASQLRQGPVMPFAELVEARRRREDQARRDAEAKELADAIRSIVTRSRFTTDEIRELFSAPETRTPERLAAERLFTIDEITTPTTDDAFALIVRRIHEWTQRGRHPHNRTRCPKIVPPTKGVR